MGAADRHTGIGLPLEDFHFIKCHRIPFVSLINSFARMGSESEIEMEESFLPASSPADEKIHRPYYL
jgi:hypothetical protein